MNPTGARSRPSTLSKLLAVGVAALLLVQPIRAGERSPRPPRAVAKNPGGREAALRLLRAEDLERRKELETMEPISAGVVKNTVDKGAIAAEVHASLKSLKEMGNPHIPAGFLLKEAQDDPDRQVDAATKSADYARMLRARGIAQSPQFAYEALHGARSRSTPAPADLDPLSIPSVPSSTPWRTVAVLAGGVLALALLALLAVVLVVVRRRRDRGRSAE